MTKRVIVSAPGKLMIMGEHAVVYGHSCIATAVGQRMYATVERFDESVFVLDAPDVALENYEKPMMDIGKGDMPKGVRFVEIATRNFLATHPWTGGVHVSIRSEFASTFGFGSSSAATVCVLKALFVLCEIEHNANDIFSLAFKTVLDVQGKGSGFDVAAAVYGGTFSYSVERGMMESLPTVPLVIGYSGTKADTVRLIDDVARRGEERGGWEDIYKKIGELVGMAIDSFFLWPSAKERTKESAYAPIPASGPPPAAHVIPDGSFYRSLGDLMNENQRLLEILGVNIPKLDAMIAAARGAGAYGAKLSGAGGGDCMIALVDEDKRSEVSDAITQAGGHVIDVDVGVEGVRVE